MATEVERAQRTERDVAIELANRVLDRPYGDPDDDLAILARQFLRAVEAHPTIETIRDYNLDARCTLLLWVAQHNITSLSLLTELDWRLSGLMCLGGGLRFRRSFTHIRKCFSSSKLLLAYRPSYSCSPLPPPAWRSRCLEQ